MSASAQITWTDVDSSNIRRVAYCEQTQMLGIEFHRGTFYSYEGVPVDVYYGLAGANSVGLYFHQVIKKTGLYDYDLFQSQQDLENKLLHRVK